MKERDPNRKLDEIEHEEEEEEEEEQEEEEEEEEENEPEKPDATDEKPEPEPEQQPPIKSEPEKEPSPEPQPPTPAEITAPVNAEPVQHSTPPAEPSQEQFESTQPIQKPVEPVVPEPPSQNDEHESKEAPKTNKPSLPKESTKPIKKTIELKKKKVVDTPVKPLDRESFAQHIKTLHSHDVMRPLLYDNDLKVGNDVCDSLKSKIKQKFNSIKPTLAIVKASKPGLKLEQILKSKLAQKLAANSPSTSETKETLVTDAAAASASSSTDAPSIESPIVNSESAVETVSVAPSDAATLKRKLSNEEVSTEVKKTKPNEADDEDEEIEEPVMLVTGVGSGKACDTGNETDREKKTESAPPSNAPQLTHKVDDILKKGESENGESTSASDETSHLPPAKSEAEVAGEKKKPKLWTIDAICSSDTKETKRSDDISSFPNYSFNRDSKKSENSLFRSSGSGESYSIFNLAADSKEDHSMSMPTNFYFGCNNQNPCFLPSERSPMNNYKQPNKTHNVKDFVDELEAKESCYSGASEIPRFNVESLCSKAPPTVNDTSVKACVDSESELASSNKTEKVLNLSGEFSSVDDRIESRVVKPALPENVCQAGETTSSVEMSSESAVESSCPATKTVDNTRSESPTIHSETANPPVDVPEPAINFGAASLKPIDEAAPVESVSSDMTNQNVEPSESQDFHDTSDSRIEPKLEEVTGELSKPVPTDVESGISGKPVAVERLTEAVNEKTEEKTDIDLNVKFDAVKSPHPTPKEEKPTSSEVFDEPVHKSEPLLSCTKVPEVDETKPIDEVVTDTEASSPLASPSGSPLPPYSSPECVAEHSSEPIAESSILNESHQKPVEEDKVPSSSQISAIETAKSSKSLSTAVSSIKSEPQPEVSIEAADRTELQSVDKRLLSIQKTTASEPAESLKVPVEPAIESSSDRADAQVESKDFLAAPEDTMEQQSVPKDKSIELPAGQPSRQTSSNWTEPADDAVTTSASDASVKTHSKDEAVEVEGVTDPPIQADDSKAKEPEYESSATPTVKVDTKPSRKEVKDESDVDELKQGVLDGVDKADVEKTESSDDNKTSTESAKMAVEAKKLESDSSKKTDQSKSIDDESVESAAAETINDDTESKLTPSQSEQLVVEEKSTDADVSPKKSESPDSQETKPETSQPTDDSKDSLTQPTSGRRKTRRSEASRLMEENGPASEKPVESVAPKRSTRRSQVGADVEEESVKEKPTKGGKGKAVTPAESKRGRKNQSVEKPAAKEPVTKEPAGRKGKGKATVEEAKRVESSKNDKETTPAKAPPAKKRGRAKKLSKFSVFCVDCLFLGD